MKCGLCYAQSSSRRALQCPSCTLKAVSPYILRFSAIPRASEADFAQDTTNNIAQSECALETAREKVAQLKSLLARKTGELVRCRDWLSMRRNVLETQRKKVREARLALGPANEALEEEIGNVEAMHKRLMFLREEIKVWEKRRVRALYFLLAVRKETRDECSISGISLKNSGVGHSAESPRSISVAISSVVLLVQLLSKYLNAPLIYDLAFSATCSIYTGVIVPRLQGEPVEEQLPLYIADSSGLGLDRFFRAVELLSIDIRMLAAVVGVAIPTADSHRLLLNLLAIFSAVVLEDRGLKIRDPKAGNQPHQTTSSSSSSSSSGTNAPNSSRPPPSPSRNSNLSNYNSSSAPGRGQSSSIRFGEVHIVERDDYLEPLEAARKAMAARRSRDRERGDFHGGGDDSDGSDSDGARARSAGSTSARERRHTTDSVEDLPTRMRLLSLLEQGIATMPEKIGMLKNTALAALYRQQERQSSSSSLLLPSSGLSAGSRGGNAPSSASPTLSSSSMRGLSESGGLFRTISRRKLSSPGRLTRPQSEVKRKASFGSARAIGEATDDDEEDDEFLMV